jgi:hypothetical protein
VIIDKFVIATQQASRRAILNKTEHLIGKKMDCMPWQQDSKALILSSGYRSHGFPRVIVPH